MSFAESCLTALAAGAAYPRFSATQPDAGTDDAYAAQAEYVTLRAASVPIIGYKAALTNGPAQTAMGIDTPIVGVLFADARIDDVSSIPTAPGAILETEIGYRLQTDVETSPTLDSVGALIDSRSAMIELARPNIDGRPSAIDLIATNSASYRVIEGGPLEGPEDEVVASLESETLLFEGPASEVMGGQRHALVWLINTVLELGYPLRAGQRLMTGSIGGVAPARAGRYRANFSRAETTLATIRFDLSESPPD